MKTISQEFSEAFADLQKDLSWEGGRKGAVINYDWEGGWKHFRKFSEKFQTPTYPADKNSNPIKISKNDFRP